MGDDDGDGCGGDYGDRDEDVLKIQDDDGGDDEDEAVKWDHLLGPGGHSP